MRIALLLTALSNNGPILVAYDQVRLLLEAGHKCEVFYFKDFKELDFPCPTRKIGLFSNFDFDSYDVIHCHGLRPDLFVTIRKPLFCKTPVVTTMHSYLFKDHYYQFGKYLSKITGRIVLLSTIRDTAIITLSKDALKYYSHYLPAKKLNYIYNTRICDKSLPVEDFLNKKIRDFKGESVLLGANCTLIPIKNLSVIIRCLPSLPNLKFCICGDGPEYDNWLKLADDLNVSKRVLFLGRQPSAHRFLRYYDVYVMPSKSEGFPLAITEAACYHKAIACSDLPIFKEIFNECEVAIFDNEDQYSVIRALKYASENYIELGENAYGKYEKCYCPAVFLKNHLDLYNRLILENKL